MRHQFLLLINHLIYFVRVARMDSSLTLMIKCGTLWVGVLVHMHMCVHVCGGSLLHLIS